MCCTAERGIHLEQEKKIAVVGVGGVGGYLAALLAERYPHVSLVARGARRAALEQNGLILHSDYRGEHMSRPERIVESAEELEPQDYIFVCVKNYSLEEVCRSMKHCVAEHTVVVPVMNGVDPGERARQYLDCGLVIDSLIYIVTFANPDFSITQQGDFANVHVGIQHADAAQTEKIRAVAELMNGAGIDCEAHEDILAEIWKKYILNCAYNVETARYDNTIGELRRDPKKAAEYEALVEEAYQVARAKGIHVTDADRDFIVHKFYHILEEGATSSMQRDVNAHRKVELETFSGYIVKEAARLHVDAPVSGQMYEALKQICGM